MKELWKDHEVEFLSENYASHGVAFCAEKLGKRRSQIRDKASRMGLRADRASDHFKEWQSRAASSKIGKKRPSQADVMRKNHLDGKFKKTPEQVIAMGNRMKCHWEKNPHPRGSLGMKHSEKTKAIISQKSCRMWAEMSQEKRDKHSRCASINGSQNKNRESATWKAGWREFGGVRKYYRSRWEANYGRYLQWLKESGNITAWEHEPETFWFDGIKRGCMSYLPDFRVTENSGTITYHEVKGWMDDRSKTKISRMARYHPNVRLILICAKEYKAIAKKVAGIIPGWE